MGVRRRWELRSWELSSLVSIIRTVKIYTKTGDGGDTALDGTRVPKSDSRVSTYGEVDELNAWSGSVRTRVPDDLASMIERIQRDLFALGARLADPAGKIAARVTKAVIGADDGPGSKAGSTRSSRSCRRCAPVHPGLRRISLGAGAHVADRVLAAERQWSGSVPASSSLTFDLRQSPSDLFVRHGPSGQLARGRPLKGLVSPPSPRRDRTASTPRMPLRAARPPAL